MTPTAQKTDLIPALLPGQLGMPQAKGQFCGFYAAREKTNYKASPEVLDRTDDKPITTKDCYRDMFDQQVKKADMRAVFTEYASYMNWCDPCAADPLSHEELRSLGAFWLNETPPVVVLPGRESRPIMSPMGGARDVFKARHPANLTGWQLAGIRQQMNLRTADAGTDAQRWQNLWTC